MIVALSNTILMNEKMRLIRCVVNQHVPEHIANVKLLCVYGVDRKYRSEGAKKIRRKAKPSQLASL